MSDDPLGPLPPSRLRAEISIRDVPSVVHEMRVAMADILRQVAQDEEPVVARRLTEIAAWFETGQAWDESDGAA